MAPEIDYKATFSGQEWKINDWTAYGINEDNPLVANSNTAIQAHLPPYREAVQGPRRDSEAASTTHEEAPIYLSIRPPRPPPCSETSESIPDTESIHSLKVGGDDVTYTLLGAEEPMEPQDTGEQSFLPGKTGTQPQEHETDSQEVDSGSSVVQRTHGKRKADEAFSSTATIDGRSTALKEPEGADLRQIIPIFNPAVARVSRKEFQTCAVEIAWRRLIIFGRSIFDDEGPNHRFFTRVQYRWFCDAVLWFKTTWEREHDAHEFYLTELSALCSAIIMQNRPGFDQFRTICMSKSIQRVGVTMDQGPWGIRLVERATWIGRFIYERLGASADTLIMDDLKALHRGAHAWQNVGGDTGSPKPGRTWDFHCLENSFKMQMTACLVFALCKRSRMRQCQTQNNEKV